jgi:hypothetical protein
MRAQSRIAVLDMLCHLLYSINEDQEMRSDLSFILCTHAATKVVAIASRVTTGDQSEMKEAMTNATQK